MSRLFKTPKIQMAFVLFVIFITALIRQPSFLVLFRFLTAVGLAIGVDIMLLKVRKIEPFFPSAGIVTAFIIGLLLAPTLPLVELISAVLLAILSKHFLRIDRKHIFNPAAFGLFFAGLIFGQDVSWWAVSFQQLKPDNLFLFLSFGVLFLPAYISVLRMRRFWTVFPFLLMYSLFRYVLIRNLSFLDPTVLFFSLVLLPEPMTTPHKPLKQVVFGIFVAVLSIFISTPISVPDPLIGALLFSNLVTFRWR